LDVEPGGALPRLHEIAQVQAVFLRVGVGVGVLYADEERRGAAKLLAERIYEADGATAADGDGLGPVALAQRLDRGLERGRVGARVPPAPRAFLVDFDLHAPGRIVLQGLGETPFDVLGVH